MVISDVLSNPWVVAFSTTAAVSLASWMGRILFLRYQTQNAAPAPKVNVTVIGGGGGGGVAQNGAAGGGGGGGGVVQNVTIPLKPGSYEVQVGEGGKPGAPGGTSSFGGIIVAHGGEGGKGGTIIQGSDGTSA